MSVFANEMALRHPLVRIPSLVVEGGEVLYDSAAILDYLDEQVPPEKALMPRAGDERRRVMQATVMAAGTIEKAGAVVYERHHHEGASLSLPWVSRCLGQVAGGLAYLEEHVQGSWYFGGALTQADVTLGCLLGYLHLRLPEAIPAGRFPALQAHYARCGELDAFRATVPSPDEVMPTTPSTAT